jgi:agmatinase
LKTQRPFYTTEPNPGFLGVKGDKPFIDAFVLGVPFDSGVSWRPGTRFGPQVIRDASLNIETYSYRYGKDAAELRIEDIGDVSVVHGDTAMTLSRVQNCVEELAAQSPSPIILIGGEHTMTLAAVRALKPDAFVVFDAHTDMRDEYLGFNLSHATVSRRVSEVVGASNVFQLGMRASSKEELNFINSNDVFLYSCLKIHDAGLSQAKTQIRERLAGAKRVYISVDLDVLDPSCMPGVGNPEAEGLAVSELLALLDSAVDQRLVGFDLMELNPMADPSGISAVTAARIALEVITKRSMAHS